MARLAVFGSIAAIVGALTFVNMSSANAGDPCVRKDFKTTLVKNACQNGGQKAAKDSMKVFMKEKKIKDCKQCHSTLGPGYELKADGLAQFKKAGGS